MKRTGAPKIRRRALLGTLGASAALGLLGPAVRRAQGALPPKRFVVFHTPNGLCQPGWFPSASDATFGSIQEPLAAHASRLLLLDGIDMKSCAADPAFAANHPELYTHNLTAANMVVKDGEHYQKFWGGGPSVDQKIAAFSVQNEPELPFGSFTFAVDPQGASSSQSRISYKEDGTTVPLVDDPLVAFQQLFGTADLGTEELEALLAERRSMLDLVLETEITQLQGRLGSEDNQRLEAHLDGLRAIEKRLQLQLEACTLPDMSLHADEPDFVKKGKLHMDLLVQALACGLTRVANIQWGYGTIFMSYPWADCYSPHHALSHGGPEGTTAEERTAESIRIGQFYAGMLAYLLDALGAVVDGEGTLLDNTLVLWTSEHGSAPASSDGHDMERMPFLLAGNLGGALATGQRLVYSARPHNDLFVSMCNLYGMELSTFGNPEVCTGALTGLLR